MKLDIKTRQRFEGYRDRVKLLRGLTADPKALDGLDVLFEQALDQSAERAAAEAEEVKKGKELLDAARRGNDDAMKELCALRMEQVDLYVRASSNFATLMYEPIVLQPNEQFCIEHSYRNITRVRFIGQDGGARTVKAVKARAQTFVDVRELHSEELGYQLRDIQQGNDVAAAAQATADVGWDLTNKVDVEAFNLLQGGTINGQAYGAGVYGSFRTTGAKLSQTYLPHPRIQTANLPTKNLFVNADLDDGGTSNVFRLAVIRKIMNYCDSWGNIFGAPIRPTGAIMIPSSETTGLTGEIKPTGTFYNRTAEGILHNYTVFEYMGVQWTLVPDVTLPPGACYPVLNRPVGKLLTKPSLDMEFVESSPKKNWETRSAMKVLAMATYEYQRVNALKIVYSSVGGAGTLTTNE
jgi:hypothetical protein